MANNWYTKSCPSCDECVISTAWDGVENLEEKEKECEYCHVECTIRSYDEIEEPEDIVTIAGAHLEDINEHSISDIPYKIWSSVQEELEKLPKETQISFIFKMMHPFMNM